MTDAEELALQEAALSAILTGGQVFKYPDGKEITRADFKAVKDRVDELRARVAAGSGTVRTFAQVNARRR